MTSSDPTPPPPDRSLREIFSAFLKLGLTSFGGPIAHIAYFRDDFVHRRRWLDERAYADLVALAQFLPGPASSQVGIGIGLSQRGLLGAVAAWAAFTLPSALLMIAFALGVGAFGDALGQGWLGGLKIAAVAVVAHAVWSMARALCPDAQRATMAVTAAAAVLILPGVSAQIGVIIAGGLAGLILLDGRTASAPSSALSTSVRPVVAVGALVIFFTLLALLPLLARHAPGTWIDAFDSFYRAGALIFGGGHVVLPLLYAEVVQSGWVDHDTFLAGYGAAQALPGPLVTFAAYLGAAMPAAPGGWLGSALLCLIAIFLPSFLLIIGCLPLWDRIRRVQPMQCAVLGINAAVVGILLAALYDPVWTSAVHSPANFALVIAAYLVLVMWKLPPWAVVGLCAMGGALLSGLGL